VPLLHISIILSWTFRLKKMIVSHRSVTYSRCNPLSKIVVTFDLLDVRVSTIEIIVLQLWALLTPLHTLLQWWPDHVADNTISWCFLVSFSNSFFTHVWWAPSDWHCAFSRFACFLGRWFLAGHAFIWSIRPYRALALWKQTPLESVRHLKGRWNGMSNHAQELCTLSFKFTKLWN